MNKFELLIRRIKMLFGAKYCNYKTRHTHDFEHTHSNDKSGYERLMFFECKKCRLKAYLDFTGCFNKV
jgi:hypothetical protein